MAEVVFVALREVSEQPELGKVPPIGLLILLILGVIFFFLFRFMDRQIKRVQNKKNDDITDPEISEHKK